MNHNIFETILARRSVRSYAPDEIERSTIHMLKAAIRAPTAIRKEPLLLAWV